MLCFRRNNRALYRLLSIFLVGLSGAAAQSVDAQTELHAAIGVLKAHDINRKHVDWAAVETHAEDMIKGKKLAADAYPAIEYAIGQMGDHHTFLRSAQHVEMLHAGKTDDNGKPIGNTTLPAAGLYPGNIVAIDIPGHTGSPESDRAYAMTVRYVLTKVQQSGICRVLIDLRMNGGGNMWPMLDGLTPLLGQGPYGYYLSPDGKEMAWNDGKTPVTQGIPAVDKREIDALGPVALAILIGPGTQSAGEFVAMAFRGRANTLFLGAPTGGFVTANGQYQLPDGALMFVAQSWAADRTHKPYKTALVPDRNTSETQTFDAGLDWLSRQDCVASTPNDRKKGPDAHGP